MMKSTTLNQLARFVPLFGRHRLAWFESLPEARLFPSDEARSDAIARVRRRIDRTWTNRILQSVVLLICWFGLHWVLKGLLPALGRWNAALAAIVSIILVELAFYSTARRFAAAELRTWLIDEGVAVCSKCGYDLRHLASPSSTRCPECGSPIVEGVRNLISPKTGDS